jgi:leucyl-tRNA synthetase
MWEKLGEKGFLVQALWPSWDEAQTIDSVVTIVVQVNGKLRGDFQAERDASREQLESTALSHEKVKQMLEGKTVRKVVVVPGKLVNIVAN